MYERDVARPPRPVSRVDFVREVFQIGAEYNFGYDTLISAVVLGDRFVHMRGRRIPYRRLGTRMKEDKRYHAGFMNTLAEQIYSIELAHVVCTITGGSLDDVADVAGYNIMNAVSQCDNAYLYKLQWEVCIVSHFTIRSNNYLTLMADLVWRARLNDSPGTVSSMFFDLSLMICLNRRLLGTNPLTILLACIMLAKRGRLAARRYHRRRIFLQTLSKVSKEYGIPFSIFVRKCLMLKNPGYKAKVLDLIDSGSATSECSDSDRELSEQADWCGSICNALFKL